MRDVIIMGFGALLVFCVGNLIYGLLLAKTRKNK